MAEAISTVPLDRLPDIEGIRFKFLDSLLDKSVKATTAKSQSSVVPSGTSFPASAVQGELLYRLDTGKLYIYDGSNWRQIPLLDTSGNLAITGRYLHG